MLSIARDNEYAFGKWTIWTTVIDFKKKEYKLKLGTKLIDIMSLFK